MLATVATKTLRDRWKGMVIAGVSLALMLLFAMAVYRDIDISVYTDLPEAFRSLINIPKDADVGSLAYGAIYSTYGALTLASLALSMGSASIAGEERDGTLGLLLGNPKSRTHVLVSKATSMLALTALGAVLLWGAAYLVPAVLNVEVGGMHINALIFHMFVIAVFHGFLAMAIGAWTGKAGLASGITAAALIISLFAVGLLPLVDGFESGAKAFPWYYYEGSSPVLNGANWGHLAVLFSGIVLLGAVALIGVNRRDLRDKATGVNLLDRLRTHPMTKKIVDRLAGSMRVSRIWMKTASEHQGLLIGTAYVMFLMMGVMLGPMFNLIEDALVTLNDSMPEAIMALVGNGDMGTPEGWYQVETFGMMVPIAFMLVTVAIGARALAGEEERRTMGLLLANPIKRSQVVLEKMFAMTVYAVAVAVAIFAGVALGSVIGRLGMSMGNIAATTLLGMLVGLVFGALSLALSAATGRSRVAIFGTVGAALTFYILNAYLPLSDSVAGLARWSPFYYYLSSDPLNTGMHWGHGVILLALAIGLVALSVALFQRRDLRQTG
jgi:ABC-2 type transport system permease protein